MNNFNLSYGNGQKVYIEKEWLLANDEIPMFFNIPDNIETEGRKVKREFVNYLESLGYIITSDIHDTDENTFFFTPCYFKKELDGDVNRYRKNKMKKIDLCLKNNNISKPRTVTFPKDHFPKRLPSLPFVLKNENEQRGVEKILISNEHDLEILKKFYDEIYEYSFSRAIDNFKKEFPWPEEIIFNPDGTSNSIWCIGRINYKEYFHNNFTLQEFIETPTEYNTSLRVLTSCSGDVLCSSLKYALPEEVSRTTFYGNVESYLMVDDNPYFITNKQIISNTVQGGKSILLGKACYSDLEKRILDSHEIDPNNPNLPDDVSNAAVTLAYTLKKEFGAISGIDFIYDKNKHKWFYLEEQEYPMLTTYCEKYNLEYIIDCNSDNYIKSHRNADIDSRVKALSLFMKN